MATVTFQGSPVSTCGNLPAVGSTAPDFTLLDGELNEISLGTFAGKKKLLNIVPSLDTPTCAISTVKFHQHAQANPDVGVCTISADLPFAQARFCSSPGKDENGNPLAPIENVKTLSMMRSKDFARAYGVLIEDSPLAGLAARAVVVLDENDKVIYTELVPEIADEPDYMEALKAIKK
jgi:thiol peroxidase